MIPRKVKLDTSDSTELDDRMLESGAAQSREDDPPELAGVLRGASFLGGGIQTDVRAFAAMTGRLLVANRLLAEALARAQCDLLTNPTETTGFLEAARIIEAAPGVGRRRSLILNEMAARCHFYCTLLGRKESAYNVAAFAVDATYSPELPAELVSAQALSAVAWLFVAAGRQPPPTSWTTTAAAEFLAAVETESALGGHMVEHMAKHRLKLRAPTTLAAPATHSGPLQPPGFTHSALTGSLYFDHWRTAANDDAGGQQRILVESDPKAKKAKANRALRARKRFLH